MTGSEEALVTPSSKSRRSSATWRGLRRWNRAREGYQQSSRLDEAERVQRRSLEINERLRRLDGMALDYASLGDIYKDRGDKATARSLWNTALELFDRIGMASKAALMRSLLDAL